MNAVNERPEKRLTPQLLSMFSADDLGRLLRHSFPEALRQCRTWGLEGAQTVASFPAARPFGVPGSGQSVLDYPPS